MCVDHRCYDLFVAEQFLNRADVIAALQKVRRKIKPQRDNLQVNYACGAIRPHPGSSPLSPAAGCGGG